MVLALSSDKSVTSKSTPVPVYDKPMICYPLSTLCWRGLETFWHLLLLVFPSKLKAFWVTDLIFLGISLSVIAEQPSPMDWLRAFVGKEFIAVMTLQLWFLETEYLWNEQDLPRKVAPTGTQTSGRATVFGYHVDDPDALRCWIW